MLVDIRELVDCCPVMNSDSVGVYIRAGTRGRWGLLGERYGQRIEGDKDRGQGGGTRDRVEGRGGAERVGEGWGAMVGGGTQC